VTEEAEVPPYVDVTEEEAADTVRVPQIVETPDVVHGPPAPWERQAFDTEESWLAFTRYRDMHKPRNQKKILGYATATISGWYRDFAWRERCEAFDRWQDRLFLDERAARIKQTAAEVAEEHKEILQDARELAMRELEKYLEVSRANGGIGLIKVGDLTKLWETVIKFDRLVRGESTETVETKVDLSALTVEELRKMRDLQSKVVKKT